MQFWRSLLRSHVRSGLRSTTSDIISDMNSEMMSKVMSKVISEITLQASVFMHFLSQTAYKLQWPGQVGLDYWNPTLSANRQTDRAICVTIPSKHAYISKQLQYSSIHHQNSKLLRHVFCLRSLQFLRYMYLHLFLLRVLVFVINKCLHWQAISTKPYK